MKDFLALLLLSSCLYVTRLNGTEYYLVKRVVDGDTIFLEKIGYVRLIGVNTPETKDPRKSVEYFSKEATSFLNRVLYNKKVRLEYEYNRLDRYNRTLAYVYTDANVFVNELIVKEGYGFAYIRYPFKYMEKFRKFEVDARSKKLGLWANKPKSIKANIVSTKLSNVSYSCNVRKKCSQLINCDEAMFLLKSCGFKRLDGNGDGVPCEKICNYKK